MSENSGDLYENKPAIPNKLLQQDGSITDLMGNVVTSATETYNNKVSIPNKFLNPDGTYSTLSDIIGGSIGGDLFVVVDELPTEGEPNKIYLVPDGEGGFNEYHYINGKWDPVGTIDVGVSPQVFYWDGNKGEIGVALWQKVVEANKNTDVIVNGENMIRNTVTHNVFTIIPKGRLYNNLITYGYSEIGFMYQTMTTNTSTPSYSALNDTMSTVKLYDDDREGVVKSIEHRSNAASYGRMQYLALDYDYPSPYTPQYDGSPATKKYVDDNIIPQVFYWNGATDTTGIQFWNDIVQISKTTPVIVFRYVSDSDKTFSSFVAFDKSTFATNPTTYTFSFTPHNLSLGGTMGDAWTRYQKYRIVVQLRF